MKGFTHLIGTNNIVELDQIRLALEHAGIEVHTKNEQSLLTGNVEFTGIAGASIMVNSRKLKEGKDVLVKMGLDTNDTKSKGFDVKWLALALLLLFGAMLFYMILAS